MGPYSSNACDLRLYPTHSGKCAMMEPAMLLLSNLLTQLYNLLPDTHITQFYQLGDRMCYLNCILWYKSTNAAAETHTQEEHSQRNEISKELASMNQHPPVHQLAVLSTGWGWDFSSRGWMCIDPCLPFFDADRFLGFLFLAACFFFSQLWPHLPSYILPNLLGPTYYY
jgi:hypothetical protein